MAYQSEFINKTDLVDLSSVAMAFSYTVTKDGFLEDVTIHFDASSSNVITVTLNSIEGAEFDIVLDTTTLSSAIDYFFQPTRPVALKKGDAIDVAVNQAGTANAGLVAKFTEHDSWVV